MRFRFEERAMGEPYSPECEVCGDDTGSLKDMNDHWLCSYCCRARVAHWSMAYVSARLRRERSVERSRRAAAELAAPSTADCQMSAELALDDYDARWGIGEVQEAPGPPNSASRASETKDKPSAGPNCQTTHPVPPGAVCTPSGEVW